MFYETYCTITFSKNGTKTTKGSKMLGNYVENNNIKTRRETIEENYCCQ